MTIHDHGCILNRPDCSPTTQHEAAMVRLHPRTRQGQIYPTHPPYRPREPDFLLRIPEPAPRGTLRHDCPVCVRIGPETARRSGRIRCEWRDVPVSVPPASRSALAPPHGRAKKPEPCRFPTPATRRHSPPPPVPSPDPQALPHRGWFSFATHEAFVTTKVLTPKSEKFNIFCVLTCTGSSPRVPSTAFRNFPSLA